MNENWHLRLAEERRRELLNEARDEQLAKDAGFRDRVPGALKVVGLVLLILPFAVVLARAATRA